MRIDGRKRVQYRVAGRTVPVRQLAEAIREGLTGEPTGTVIIFAPRTMAYSQVVRVIDSAKRAGAANIGLQQQYAP
jgi:biopolymer transport protein ExbD